MNENRSRADFSDFPGIPGFKIPGFGGIGGPGNGGSGNGGSGNEPPIQVDFDMSNLGNAIAGWARSKLIFAGVILLLVIAAAYWWFHPPISINSIDCWFFVAIFILAPLYLLFRGKSRRYETGDSRLNPNRSLSKTFKLASYIPVAIIVLGVLGGVLSLSLIPGNAERYASILKTDNLNFAEDIQEVNYTEIPVIDRDSAILLGNREMGSIPDYVSQFEVSSLYTQINYKESPVRVSPLDYADIFKWFINRSNGIPAYSLVNMTTQDAEIVRLPEGQGMKYVPSEPLSRNIERHVQLSYPFYIFDDMAFEIDDEGRPWWICPVVSYTIGLFGGETIERVILCDAVTGECTELAVSEVPEWVDRVYPTELLLRQYNWSGCYKDGWINSWLGQAGVVQTTPGTNGTLGYNYIAKDDDVWVYTGVTSATADNSIVGFVLINQRTAESHYYAVAGATEDSAMESAEGQVQNLRYTATFPLLINISNQPTYFMALKDGAGLVKKFAMIDIQRYQNVAVGDTVADCQKSYELLLASNGAITANDMKESATYALASGTIRTMVQSVVDGNSHFYVTLEGQEGIFDFPLPGLLKIVTYKVGDKISFDYVAGESFHTVAQFSGDAKADLPKETPAQEDGQASPVVGGSSEPAPATQEASPTAKNSGESSPLVENPSSNKNSSGAAMA